MTRRAVLSDGERAALPGVLEAMGFNDETLAVTSQKLMCELVHSVPYADRLDPAKVTRRLKLLARMVAAAGRAEAGDTIRKYPAAFEAFKELTGAVRSLEIQVR